MTIVDNLSARSLSLRFARIHQHGRQGNEAAERNCNAAMSAATACKSFYLRNDDWPKSWSALEADLSNALVAEYVGIYGAPRTIEASGVGVNAAPSLLGRLTLEELRGCVDIDFSADPKVLRLQKWTDFTGIVVPKPSYNLNHLQFAG